MYNFKQVTPLSLLESRGLRKNYNTISAFIPKSSRTTRKYTYYEYLFT